MLPAAGRAADILAPRPPHAPAGRRAGRGTQISYVTLLLAVLIGILHAAVAPVLAIGDVHPNLVLVAVVLVTVLRGFGHGVVWAFVGGLTANLLVHEPLGSLPLALLVVAGIVAMGDRLFGRLTGVYPLVAVALGSILADGVSLGILQLVDPPLAGAVPMQRVIGAALLNVVIAAVALVPARIIVARSGVAEKAAW